MKMDKVYGVFDGEYSDWSCLGFFENELDAGLLYSCQRYVKRARAWRQYD